MFANTRLKSCGIRPAGQVCLGNRCEYQKGRDREVGRNGMKVEARGGRFKTLLVQRGKGEHRKRGPGERREAGSCEWREEM